MEQMILLKKMDPKILEDEPENKSYCYTRECKYYNKLIKFAWKAKGELKSKLGSREGSYHAVHADRLIQNHCNEACCTTIEQRMIERNNKKQNIMTTSQ